MQEHQQHQRARADEERRHASAHRLHEVRDVRDVGHDGLQVPGRDLVDGVEGVGVEQALREEDPDPGPESGDGGRHGGDAHDHGQQHERRLVGEGIAEHGPELRGEGTGAHARAVLLGLFGGRGQAERVAARADHRGALGLHAVRAPALAALRADPLRRSRSMVGAAAPGAPARAWRPRRCGGSGPGRRGHGGDERARRARAFGRRRRFGDGWRRCQRQRGFGHDEHRGAAAAAGLQPRDALLARWDPQGLAALRTKDRHDGRSSASRGL